MKKVLLIVPNLRLGGQERVAVNTARFLEEEYEVSLLIFDDAESAYTWEGEILNIRIPAKPKKLSKIWNVWKRSLAVRRIKKEKKIDICISFGESANIVNVLSKVSDKVFTSIHGYADLQNRGLDKFLYRRSDRVLCCSLEIEKRYKEYFPNYGNSVCLYNPYNIDEIERMGKEEIKDNFFQNKVVISHGRLEEVKNYPRLIRAFSLVRRECEDARLVIIGEGSKREALEGLILELGLAASVKLIGFRTNPFSYLARSFVYVLSSYNEGFPNALAEGMVFLPVISVDCKSGPGEMLDGNLTGECKGVEEARYGVLVNQVGKEEDEGKISEGDRNLAEAISIFFKEDEKREEYKKRARRRVEDFSETAYKENLKKILEEK